MSDGPASMPGLGRGRRRSPARGAWLMECTALLAAEPFGDAPGCVDGELAAAMRHADDSMRHADDRMPGADRPRLLPLLGRVIGPAVPEPVAYVDRLLNRLLLLHECYQQAMDELALPRAVPAERGERESPDVLAVTS